jgi:hypothetical protein
MDLLPFSLANILLLSLPVNLCKGDLMFWNSMELADEVALKG